MWCFGVECGLLCVSCCTVTMAACLSSHCFPLGPHSSLASLCFRAGHLLSRHKHPVDLLPSQKPSSLVSLYHIVRCSPLWSGRLVILVSTCVEADPFSGIVSRSFPSLSLHPSLLLELESSQLFLSTTVVRKRGSHLSTEQMVGTDLAQELRAKRRRCFHDNQG